MRAPPAWPLWHVTADPDWKLDPAYHPIWAYGARRPHRQAGLFVTERPDYWEPFMGIGPLYAVRIEVPSEALKSPGPTGSAWPHPEYFIEDFERLQIVDTVSLQEALERGDGERQTRIAWDWQLYGGFGSIEDWWYMREEVWDEKGGRFTVRYRPRKGLAEPRKAWRRRTGFRNPIQRDRPSGASVRRVVG